MGVSKAPTRLQISYTHDWVVRRQLNPTPRVVRRQLNHTQLHWQEPFSLQSNEIYSKWKCWKVCCYLDWSWHHCTRSTATIVHQLVVELGLYTEQECGSVTVQVYRSPATTDWRVSSTNTSILAQRCPKACDRANAHSFLITHRSSVIHWSSEIQFFPVSYFVCWASPWSTGAVFSLSVDD